MFIHVCVCACVCVRVCICNYIYTYIYIHIYVYIYMYLYIYVHTYVIMYMYTYIYKYVYMHIYMYICIYIYICIHTYIHAHLYMCILIYMRIVLTGSTTEEPLRHMREISWAGHPVFSRKRPLYFCTQTSSKGTWFVSLFLACFRIGSAYVTCNSYAMMNSNAHKAFAASTSGWYKGTPNMSVTTLEEIYMKTRY